MKQMMMVLSLFVHYCNSAFRHSFRNRLRMSTYDVQINSPSNKDQVDANSYKISLRKEIIDDHLKYTTEVTDTDIECINTRQLTSNMRNENFIGVDKTKCKYGYSRAFVRFPVDSSYQSGMIRLSCPHLVKAIDQFEAEGGIKTINSILQDTTTRNDINNINNNPDIISSKSQTSNTLNYSEELRQNFLETNQKWNLIRNISTTDYERSLVRNYLTPEGYDSFFNCGIIGITIDKVDDVKCLHAHTADYLLRGENKIGEWTIQQLELKGISANGCDNCWQQCNVNHERTEDSWWYIPQKNKQKLKQIRKRRKIIKENKKIAELHVHVHTANENNTIDSVNNINDIIHVVNEKNQIIDNKNHVE